MISPQVMKTPRRRASGVARCALVVAPGARGDIAPLVGLGARLRAEGGHEVAVVADARYAPLIRDAGFDHTPIPADLAQLIAETGDDSRRRTSVRVVRDYQQMLTEYLDAPPTPWHRSVTTSPRAWASPPSRPCCNRWNPASPIHRSCWARGASVRSATGSPGPRCAQCPRRPTRPARESAGAGVAPGEPSRSRTPAARRRPARAPRDQRGGPAAAPGLATGAAPRRVLVAAAPSALGTTTGARRVPRRRTTADGRRVRQRPHGSRRRRRRHRARRPEGGTPAGRPGGLRRHPPRRRRPCHRRRPARLAVPAGSRGRPPRRSRHHGGRPPCCGRPSRRRARPQRPGVLGRSHRSPGRRSGGDTVHPAHLRPAGRRRLRGRREPRVPGGGPTTSPPGSPTRTAPPGSSPRSNGCPSRRCGCPDTAHDDGNGRASAGSCDRDSTEPVPGRRCRAVASAAMQRRADETASARPGTSRQGRRLRGNPGVHHLFAAGRPAHAGHEQSACSARPTGTPVVGRRCIAQRRSRV